MPLHACANCKKFLPRGPTRCMVPDAPRILDPRSGNHCPYFDFADSREGADAAESSGPAPTLPERKADARQRWEDLFA